MRTSNEITFGQLVGSYRTLRARISQDAFADLIGISKASFRKWEIDQSKPSAQNLQKLLEVLLDLGVFTAGKEIEEARAFWQTSGVNVVFDEVWTNALANTRRSRSKKRELVDAAFPQAFKVPTRGAAEQDDCKTEQPSSQSLQASSSMPSETNQDISRFSILSSDSESESVTNLVDTSSLKEENPPRSNVFHEDIIGDEGGPMRKDRRNLTIALAGIPLVLPGIGQQNFITEVQRVLHQPSSGLGDKELEDLEQRIRGYWLARNSVTIAPTDLLLNVGAYVQDVKALLDSSLLPSIRTRLCACLSQGMLLIGVISYDAAQFQMARVYYQTAIDAAHEARDNILQALAWIWNSYSWMRGNEEDRYEYARDSVSKARHLAFLESDLAVQCNALEASAEVHAYLKEQSACIEALESLAKLAAGCMRGDWWYIHQFDQAKLNGVRGICLQQFYRPDAPDTDSFLQEAMQALKDALSQPNVLALRRTFHVADMAQIYARKSEVESACSNAREIITIANTKAPIRQRLWIVRTLLEPYTDVATVKDLDREITMTLLGQR